MANAAHKWFPLVLIAAATAASAAVYDGLPPVVRLPLEGILPFELSEPAGPVGREAVLFLMPALMVVVWAAFRLVPTAAGERMGRRLLPNAPDAVTSPAQFERFGKAYDTIVIGVILLLLGGHAAMLSAALGHPGIATRIIPMMLGASLVVMGNVMPRLRPNWVAGVRTRRTFENPQLWRASHRAFGTALVVSGILTMIVGAAAPRYGLATGLATLLASCVTGFVASIRRPLDAPPVAE
jgi:SdpI/YfhL protein family